GEGRGTAALVEAVGAQVDISKVGERFERYGRCVDPVAKLTECLRGADTVVRTQPIVKSRKSNRARHRDVVPGVGHAGSQTECSPLRAAVDADMIVVAMT